MKILMVNKFLYQKGGAETYFLKLGKYFQSLGNEVEYFGMDDEKRSVSNSAEQYTKNLDFHGGSKLAKITYPFRIIYSREAKKKMKKVLETFEPDVIHLNNFNFQLTPSIIIAANEYRQKANKKVKIVYTAHDTQLVCPNHSMLDINCNTCEKCVGGKYYNCAKGKCIHSSFSRSVIGVIEAYLYKLLKTYRHIDVVICCSNFIKKMMDTNPDIKGRTHVIHNFVEEVEQKTQIKRDDYVLYFGRYAVEKGINDIIKAKNVNFICAGAGDLEDSVNNAQNITNVGFKTGEDLEMLIRRAKCTVYPSIWYENCPFSVLESIMYGTPVVGANIGGIPELIKDGETGFLFESRNIKEFENAINKILDDDNLAAQMSQNCLKAKFDTVQSYGDKLMAFYV